MNAHVLLYYRWMLWLAEKEKMGLAQLTYFTLLMKEENGANWKP